MSNKNRRFGYQNQDFGHPNHNSDVKILGWDVQIPGLDDQIPDLKCKSRIWTSKSMSPSESIMRSTFKTVMPTVTFQVSMIFTACTSSVSSANGHIRAMFSTKRIHATVVPDLVDDHVYNWHYGFTIVRVWCSTSLVIFRS